MLHTPTVPEYLWRIGTGSARPSATWGVTYTPGNNTKGAWVQAIAGASVVNDVWAMDIWIAGIATSAAIKNTLIDIGIDLAGGTSYTVLINDLLPGQPAVFSGGNAATRFSFPLFIPAGASIGVRGSVNNSTVQTGNVMMMLYGKPKYPETTWFGTNVQTIGATTASSSGTAVTGGSASEGAWTLLGSLTREARYWQWGYGTTDTTQTTTLLAADFSVGSAGGDTIVLSEMLVFTTSSEVSMVTQPSLFQCYTEAASGSNVYGRIQSQSTADTGLSLIAYALS